MDHRSKKYLRGKNVRTLLLGLITGVLVCFGLIMMQGWLREPCHQRGCYSFNDFQAADWTCIADPTCVSPLYKEQDRKAQNWTGPAYWNLGLERDYPSPTKVLAAPNYIVFMLLAGACVAYISTRHSTQRRALLLVIFFTWVSLEIAEWFYVAFTYPAFNYPLWYTPSFDYHDIVYSGISVLVFSLAIFGSIAYFGIHHPRRAKASG